MSEQGLYVNYLQQNTAWATQQAMRARTTPSTRGRLAGWAAGACPPRPSLPRPSLSYLQRRAREQKLQLSDGKNQGIETWCASKHVAAVQQ